MASIWDQIKKNAEAVHGELAKQVSRYKGLPILEWVTISAALITKADTVVTTAEVDKVISVLTKHPALAGFSADEKAKKFRDALKAADDELESILLWGKLAGMKSNPEAAATIVNIAVMIANADGDFAESEKAVVRRICKTVDLDPSAFL